MTTIVGIEAEVIKVANAIEAEAEYRGAEGTTGTNTTRQLVRTMSRLATRLHRAYEQACNGEQKIADIRRERDTEARIIAMCHRMGVTVRFNGDPRGAPVQIPCAKENANGFGGECIVIPYGPARDYKDVTVEI
jgi:hypothetical protein